MPLVVKNVSPVRWRQPVYCTSTVSPRWTRAPLVVAASILYANPEDVFIASFGRVLMSSGGMTCGITRLAECADASDSSSGSLESPWHADTACIEKKINSPRINVCMAYDSNDSVRL